MPPRWLQKTALAPRQRARAGVTYPTREQVTEVNNPTISLDLTKSGIGSVVVCERNNYQGTETGPISGDTEILIGLAGLHIVLTFAQLTELVTAMSQGGVDLPEKRRRDYTYWSEVRARKAASA